MSLLSSVLNKITGNKSGKISLYKKYDLGASCLAVPISADIDGDGKNEIICATTKGDIFVMDSELNLKWKFSASSEVGDMDKFFLDSDLLNGIHATPKIFDINKDGKNELIFGTEQGEVFAINYKGEQIWKFKVQGSIRGGINIFYMSAEKNIKIIFGSLDGHIYILNESGKLELDIVVGVGIESTPVIFEDFIIVGTTSGEIRAYNVLGKLAWSYNVGAKITSDAVVIKCKGMSCFVIGSTNNSLYCFDGKGKLIWQFVTTGAIYSSAVIKDVNGDGLDEIVFGAADNKIHVLNMDGKELWSYEAGFWIIGPPVIIDIDSDGVLEVIAGSYDNMVYFLAGDGDFVMDYVPGISGIVAQNGSYSDIPSNSPGNVFGKKIWGYDASGMVIGCCAHDKMVVVQTKEGKVLILRHEGI
ncbi:MAG: FG-GAP-like repeat-containing protein [Candidatus Woesearchaeota archaeon]|jgi:outer membrane protein assembly factor BamB